MLLRSERHLHLYDRGTLGELESERNAGLRSMAELLPWMMVYDCNTENQVINKDSSFMACFEYTGPDTDSLPAEQILNLMQQAEKTLKTLSDYPIRLWFITHRRRIADYPTQAMPDKWSQIVDDERAHAITESANFENRHFVAVTLAAEAGLNRIWGRFKHARSHDGMSTPRALTFAVKGIWHDQYAFAYTSTELEDVSRHFERLLDTFTANLPSMNLQRLAGDDLAGFMHVSCTPASDHYPSKLEDFLDDAMTNGEVIVGPNYLWFHSEGLSRVGVVSSMPTTTKAWPDRIFPQDLDALLKVPAELTISHVICLQNEGATESMIDSMRRYHESKKLNLKGLLASVINKGDPSFTPRENRGRLEAAEEAENLKADVYRGRKTYGQYTFSITAYSSRTKTYEAHELGPALAEAEAANSLVHKALERAKFRPIRENIGALSAWTASIPGSWRDAARWAPISNKVFARLVPLRTVASGSREDAYLSDKTKHPSPALSGFPTDYATPFYWSMFTGDVGHMLICGPTRGGKTTFLNLAWTLARKYYGTEVFVFDRTHSSRIPILMQGGLYFDPSSPNGATLNPISLIGQDRHLKYVKDWICLVAGLRGYEPTTDDHQQLTNILKASRHLPRQHWRMGAVVAQLPLGALRDSLMEWVGNSVTARWFDNSQDLFEGLDTPDESSILMASWATRPIGIEMSHVLEQPDVALPFLSYCFYRINDRIEMRKTRGQVAPTIICLPEVWSFLNNRLFADQLSYWIKTLGKQLGMVWMDAQSPDDYLGSPLYHTFRDNVPNRIIVPFPGADGTDTLRKVFSQMGLNPQQIEAIAQGTPKQDYFLNHKDGFQRRIVLRLDPRTLAILRSELDAQVIFNKWFATGREDWREMYFEEMTR